jgi:hypothetical protein
MNWLGPPGLVLDAGLLTVGTAAAALSVPEAATDAVAVADALAIIDEASSGEIV